MVRAIDILKIFEMSMVRAESVYWLWLGLYLRLPQDRYTCSAVTFRVRLRVIIIGLWLGYGLSNDNASAFSATQMRTARPY